MNGITFRLVAELPHIEGLDLDLYSEVLNQLPMQCRRIIDDRERGVTIESRCSHDKLMAFMVCAEETFTRLARVVMAHGGVLAAPAMRMPQVGVLHFTHDSKRWLGQHEFAPCLLRGVVYDQNRSPDQRAVC